MGVKPVEQMLHLALLRHGLQRERVHKLRFMYTRNSVVSPALLMRVVGDRRGNYKVDGGVTVIHRRFEEYWAIENIDVTLPKFAFDSNALFLHISNIRDVSLSSYLGAGDDTSLLDNFCTSVSRYLDELPGNEETLISAFRSNKLGSIPLDSFVPGAYHPDACKKFGELRNYLISN